MTENNIKLIKKILNILWKIFYQIFIIICIALILIIVLQRVTNSNRSVKGLRLFRVISGSMVPQYDVGQIVICKDIDISDLKIGDTVVYRGDTGEFDGKIIMHNVVEIKDDENGKKIIITQGLYNTVGDPEISEEQIYGKVVAKTHILTILYDLSNNIYTFFIIIFILVLNIFLSWKKPKIDKLSIDANNEENIEEIEEYEDEEDDEDYDDEDDENDDEDDDENDEDDEDIEDDEEEGE